MTSLEVAFVTLAKPFKREAPEKDLLLVCPGDAFGHFIKAVDHHS